MYCFILYYIARAIHGHTNFKYETFLLISWIPSPEKTARSEESVGELLNVKGKEQATHNILLHPFSAGAPSNSQSLVEERLYDIKVVDITRNTTNPFAFTRGLSREVVPTA